MSEPKTAEVKVAGPLWMMHVIGPDDLYPAPDHATAVDWCFALNGAIGDPTDVFCVAVPALWTGTPAQHAAGLPDAITACTPLAAPASPPAETGEGEAIQQRAYDLLVAGVEGFLAMSAGKKTDIHRVLCTALSAHPVSPSEGEATAWLYTENRWKDGPRYRLSMKRQAISPEDANEFEITEDALFTHPASDQSDTERMRALADIAAERLRQVEAEGWTAEHDDAHDDFELSRAASGYAAMPWRRTEKSLLTPTAWPWGPESWKPKDNRSDLIRAGALIVAEIERLDRAALAEKAADK